ncbi:MAG: penicillin-binding protein 2 [Acidobacteriota bacterium]|nr:penicillin-binding protein 2 [Acidobacteriota bacterium]
MPKRSPKISRKKNPMQTVFTRFMLIVAFFILWIGGIGVRLVHLQVNQHEWLLAKALDQRRNQVKSKQLRGTIYDRSARALAMSVNAKSLFADPSEIEDVEGTAKRVAAVLKVKPNEIVKDLTDAKEKGKRFVYLARKLDEDEAERINDALKDTDLRKFDEPRFTGLHWQEEQKRSYPYKSLAAQVVGFSNSEDVGSAGIEQSQEELLRGAGVRKWQDRDRLGRVYDETEEVEEREPPKDIFLTISNSIQYKTEQALEEGVKATRAKSGMAIVLDPKTGEILAMANYPTFDPNKFNEAAPETLTNRAVQSMYSPGSVFKLVTYGAALQEKLIRPDGEIDCSKGFIEVAGHRFDDPHATKTMSYGEALAVSSNYAAIKTALGLGKDRFYNYALQFGFGAPTGIELPAEARGQIRPPATWYGDSLASMSIGYELNITALQAASAYAAIANDGVRVRPHIIKEIRTADGKVLPSPQVEKTQVVNAEAARGLRQMLRQVVLKGTAKRAQLNGYTSAGKTGTAWKYDARIKRYNESKYVSSFVGFAPADNPSVVIAVVMDEPQGGARDGGQVSAPVFRQIAEQILPELNVAPDDSIQQENLTAQNDIPKEADIAPRAPRHEEPENIPTKLTDKAINGEKTKEIKKESKPGSEKNQSKQKTAVITTVKPKGDAKSKSASERTRQKT